MELASELAADRYDVPVVRVGIHLDSATDSTGWLEDIADIKQTIWLTLAGLVVMGSIMYGPPVVKFAAIATAMVAGCVAFFRGPLGRA